MIVGISASVSPVACGLALTSRAPSATIPPTLLFRRIFSAVLVVALCALAFCCASTTPTSAERAEYEAYARVVPARIREEAMHTVSRRTDWAERKKILWLTDKYKSWYQRNQKTTTSTGPATTQAATGPASTPATQVVPVTRPATQTAVSPASSPASKPAPAPIDPRDSAFHREEKLLAIARRYLLRRHPEWVAETNLKHRITDEGTFWRITYTLPPDRIGGVPVIEIDKETQAVLRAYHTQ